jgi:hypothetical protein
MTPKEKAEELVSKYLRTYPIYNNPTVVISYTHNEAKQCALITVDELTEGIRSYDVFLHHKSAKDFMKLNSTIETNLLSYLNYWQEVKQEIELL